MLVHRCLFTYKDRCSSQHKFLSFVCILVSRSQATVDLTYHCCLTPVTPSFRCRVRRLLALLSAASHCKSAVKQHREVWSLRASKVSPERSLAFTQATETTRLPVLLLLPVDHCKSDAAAATSYDYSDCSIKLFNCFSSLCDPPTLLLRVRRVSPRGFSHVAFPSTALAAISLRNATTAIQSVLVYDSKAAAVVSPQST